MFLLTSLLFGFLSKQTLRQISVPAVYWMLLWDQYLLGSETSPIVRGEVHSSEGPDL